MLQFVALQNAVGVADGQCSAWIAGFVVVLILVVLSVVALAAVSCVVWKRRQEGYSAIDRINTRY